MPAITVRNLSGETHRALKARATAHHRSTEAEVRAILDAAVRPASRAWERYWLRSAPRPTPNSTSPEPKPITAPSTSGENVRRR